MSGRNTTDGIIALRMWTEEYRGQKTLNYVFNDLEKAYDRVSRNITLHERGNTRGICGSCTGYYNMCSTMVRCAAGTTNGFQVEVGLNQGSALRAYSQAEY
jgi:hypothetical protein